MSKVKDHLGQEFNSEAEMCRKWGVKYSTYKMRLNKYGWSLRDALEGTMSRASKEVTDHLGNTYPSLKELCAKYNISPSTLDKRLKNNWDLERALTQSVDKTFSAKKDGVTDHLGNKFKTVTEMCSHYGVRDDTYRARLKKGYTLAQALGVEPIEDIRKQKKRVTAPKKRKKVKDHLGNEFKTVREMCAYHGISWNSYNARIYNGWTMQKALETKVKEKGAVDHLGNKFKTITEMCAHYNVAVANFRSRLRLGHSLEEALGVVELKQIKGTAGLMDVYKRKGSNKYYDHEGNVYNSLYEMCRTYGVSTSTLYNRLLSGWSAEKSLTTPVADRNNGHKIKYGGKLFKSYAEVCMYTGISVDTFRARRNDGYTIEESLLPVHDFNLKFNFVVDHLGNKFANFKEMCEFHSVSLQRFNRRRRHGCSIEECLSPDEVGVDALKKLLEDE